MRGCWATPQVHTDLILTRPTDTFPRMRFQYYCGPSILADSLNSPIRAIYPAEPSPKRVCLHVAEFAARPGRRTAPIRPCSSGKRARAALASSFPPAGGCRSSPRLATRAWHDPSSSMRPKQRGLTCPLRCCIQRWPIMTAYLGPNCPRLRPKHTTAMKVGD